MHKPFTVRVSGEDFQLDDDDRIMVIENTLITHAPYPLREWIGQKWNTFVNYYFVNDDTFRFDVVERVECINNHVFCKCGAEMVIVNADAYVCPICHHTVDVDKCEWYLSFSNYTVRDIPEEECHA